jgi:glutamate synthase (NADPH/NADH) small chain
VPGADFDLPADLIITALGFEPEDVAHTYGAPGLALSRWGTIKAVNRTLATNLEGVFAAGDIVRGASLVVWAIRDGLDAAAGVARYLEQKATAGKAAAVAQ